MTRTFLRAAAAALLALGAFTSTAVAQDGDSAAWRFESRALDMTTMLQQSHGGGEPANEVALSRVPVTVIVNAPGQTMSKTYQTKTDLVGKFVVEGDAPPPGATLDFLVPAEGGEDGTPGFYARPWVLDDEPDRSTIEFYEVAEDSRDLVLANVINIVSVVESPDGSSKDIQFRHTAMLMNAGFKVWLGDFEGGPPISFSVPIHAGFRLGHATVDGTRVPLTTGQVGHGSGDRFVYNEPIFPTGFQRGMVFQVLSSAPYEDGKTYAAAGWHNEYPIMRYSLNLEEGQFNYAPPASSSDGMTLADGGVQPAMGNTKKVTHAYTAQQIRAHSTLGVAFTAGKPFPWRPVLWTGAILLLVAGAALIGIAVARREAGKEQEVAAAKTKVKVPATASGREHELEMLDRRRKRGEITSVEYEVRKNAIETAQQGGVPVAPPPRRPATKNVDRGMARLVAEIADRADDATPEQLRKDVQTLARAVRDLLES